MSALGIMITLIIGILMLIIGAVTKKKWLTIFSILPLAVAIGQLVYLFMM